MSPDGKSLVGQFVPVNLGLLGSPAHHPQTTGHSGHSQEAEKIKRKQTKRKTTLILHAALFFFVVAGVASESDVRDVIAVTS